MKIFLSRAILIVLLSYGPIKASYTLVNPSVPASKKSKLLNPAVPPLQRTISLDLGYLPQLNSNRAIGEFDLELRQGWGALYDWQYKKWQPTTYLGRLLLYSGFNIVTWGPIMGQMATYHEYGHATRLRSIGFDTSFINIGKAAWNIYALKAEKLTLEDVLSDEYFSTIGGTVLINIVLPGTFLLSAVMPRYDKPLHFQPAEVWKHYNPKAVALYRHIFKKHLTKPYDPKKDKDLLLGERIILQILGQEMIAPWSEVIIDSGGLNNQQDQSRRVENHLWYNEGDHFAIVGTYFWDKTWAGLQSILSADNNYQDSQDTTRICRAYNKMGINLTHEEIIAYSYLSYFLSSQAYANLYQIYKTLTVGDNRVYAPEYFNIRLPNVGLYFTTKGPTYNIASGYRLDPLLYIPFSIEFGLKESVWEFNIGVRKKFQSLPGAFIHGEIVFNTEAVGGSVYGGVIWDKTWNVQAGVTYHNSKTFQGERNLPSYKSGDTDIEAWLKLGLVY